MTDYKLGILGYPLSHSVSPVLHQAFLKVVGMSGSYEKFEVPPDLFDDWMNQWTAFQLNGINVTIPYKVRVMPYMKGLSQEAQLIGAVNTVINREDGLYGDNTDAHGFMAPIPLEDRDALPNTHVLILGTGGASRAVAYALLQHQVREITFLARHLDRAVETLNVVFAINQALRGGQAQINLVTETPPSMMEAFNWVVNCTPVGMKPNVDESPLNQEQLARMPQGSLIYDLVYNPLETRLLQLAREQGLKTQDGLSMLIYQGARSFELWTGQELAAQLLVQAWPDIVEEVSKSL